jgi:DamX protein
VKPSVKSVVEAAPVVVDVSAGNAIIAKAEPNSEIPGSVRASTSRLSRDERAVMSWGANEFTLQVSASRSKSNILDFVSRQSNRAQLKIVTTRRDGSDWHVVFAGRYRNAAEAGNAKSGLPSVQQKAGPWARSAKSVQLQIKEYHGIQ